jgi:hypothetical protein
MMTVITGQGEDPASFPPFRGGSGTGLEADRGETWARTALDNKKSPWVSYQ